MSALHRRRLWRIVWLLGGSALTCGVLLSALSHNVNLFYSPSELLQQNIGKEKLFRVGGMVVKNSVVRKDNLEVEFLITDFSEQLKVTYRGILPDLFREGQGIVALGRLAADNQVEAVQVLAKHDETYMPREIKQSLSQVKAVT